MTEEKLISSESTAFFKRVNYLLTFGIAILFIAVASGIKSPIIYAIVLAGIVLLAEFARRKIMAFCGTIADEVYDCGDFLRIVKRGEEQKVPFSHITDVASRHAGKGGSRNYVITLHLRNPGKFGAQILFVVRGDMGFLWPEHPLAAELLRRAQAAQSSPERT
jgi:hypothetical protein